MSKGKCKFYNGKWHLTIRDMLTGLIFSYSIPCEVATKAVIHGESVDVIKPYPTHDFAVYFTRGYPTGIRWRITKQGCSNWEDYTPARRKLPKETKLLSFIK